MAATSVLIPVEEYLRTTYHPDCDYINGEVLERNMGELLHGGLQGFFAYFFRIHEDEWRITAIPETRLQVAPRNYRIPDFMVLSIPYSDTRVVKTPPLLCVKILSSDDRMSKLQERLDDYAAMGVRTRWVIDPWRGLAYAAGPDGILREVKDRITVEGNAISITVADIFAELDRLEKRAAARYQPSLLWRTRSLDQRAYALR